jgi:hypothetical protein
VKHGTRQPCETCGRATDNGARCPECQGDLDPRAARRTVAYRAARAQAIELVEWGVDLCRLCGELLLEGEDVDADHLEELASGGQAGGELAIVHSSCNRARGRGIVSSRTGALLNMTPPRRHLRVQFFEAGRSLGIRPLGEVPPWAPALYVRDERGAVLPKRFLSSSHGGPFVEVPRADRPSAPGTFEPGGLVESGGLVEVPAGTVFEPRSG